MPTVSFDSKSFVLPTGRGAATRFAVVGASFDASLFDPAEWPAVLARLRHVGFNTVVVRIPWLMHEPTPGRFEFTGRCDVRRVVELAGAEGLKVVLRIGPCVGGGFARGGLPGWIPQFAGDRAREAHPGFLNRVTQFWHALAPHFFDLQATRNGNGKPRPVIAVGIEDDWRCLDAEVGQVYFGALVRFAREVGVDVPLVSANNGWYTHEGVLDAWQGAAAIGQTASELRQVVEDAPPLLLHREGDRVAQAVESIASRADFACEVLGARHRDATSARGCAERAGVDLHPLRRALVFATSFGEILAGLAPDIESAQPSPAGKRRTTTLCGAAGEQVTVAVERKRVDFTASGLTIAGARLERCGGSLVALLGDLVVVAGAPRAKIAVKVDGSEATLAVPAEGGAPKVTKVRGLRVAVVTDALAAGVGLGADAIEFVDERGALRARLASDGTVLRPKPADASPNRRRAPALSAPQCIVERGLLDGTHARYARIAAPLSAGECGVQSMHACYGVLYDAPKKKGRDAWTDCRGLARTTRVERKPRGTMAAFEFRGDFLPEHGSHQDDRLGVVGPLREVAPLKAVKGEIVALPHFDATRLGRFVFGYDARPDASERATVRWSFAARTAPIVLRMPAWWSDEGHDRAGHALRLNGQIVGSAGWTGRDGVLVDGALLSPMRPKPTAKGEKPKKGKNIELVAGANELLLDLDPASPFDRKDCRRLLDGVEFLEVLGELDAAWWFARIAPPASWATATPAPRKPLSAPAWFRMTFRLDEPRALELQAVHAAGSVATVLVNGESALVLDGSSGIAGGTARKRTLARTATIPASLVRAGENEICVFEPDGAMPALTLR
jgi:Glycosyl hydrolases family 35